MAQESKETQTSNMPGGFGSMHQLGYGAMPNHLMSQYYMEKEEELYRQACRLKGIPLITEEEEEEEPTKVMYRYTLEEMKSYNPYRFYY